MAVGAVLAVHRLPNWEVASAAFAAHMQSLHCGVRPGLVKVQKAPPDGATAAQGLSFITVCLEEAAWRSTLLQCVVWHT